MARFTAAEFALGHVQKVRSRRSNPSAGGITGTLRRRQAVRETWFFSSIFAANGAGNRVRFLFVNGGKAGFLHGKLLAGRGLPVGRLLQNSTKI